MFIETIRTYNDFILLVASLFILKSTTFYSMIFVIGYFVNWLLNYVLKRVYAIPRPFVDKEIFYRDLKYKYDNNIFYIPFELLDFPSGHIQRTLFTVIFMFQFPLTNPQYLFYIFMTFANIYAIYVKNERSIGAGIVGALLGIFMGYSCYNIGKKIKTK